MVHTCATCGKVYLDSSPDILRGCSSCGGKKFYFERPGPHRKTEVPGCPPLPEPEPEPEEEREEDRFDRVESIRILGPSQMIGLSGSAARGAMLLISCPWPAKRRKRPEMPFPDGFPPCRPGQAFCSDRTIA
jgi:DNA-directed RNA polymerase subunit RPC12/RpoP